MTRISKQASKRMVSPRRPKLPGPKTGPKKDKLAKGFKEHTNVSAAKNVFIPKIKSI